MSKKSQITIFIILGILIVAAAGFLIYSNQATTQKKELFAPSISDTDSIKFYTETCIKNVLEKGLVDVGFANLLTLQNYINTNLKGCTNNFDIFTGTEVIEGDVSSRINITYDNLTLIVNVNYPLTITRQGSKAKLSDFYMNYALTSNVQLTSVVTTSQITVTSQNMLATLNIPSGVSATNGAAPVNSISMNLEDNAQYHGNTLGFLAYDLQPDGTTFNPAITLTIEYDEDQLPAGVTENNLKISYFDSSLGTWVDWPSTVDIVNNKITASINHFTANSITYIPNNITTGNVTTTCYGKADPAVYQESTGYWYILQSSEEYALATPFKLGKSGYTAVPADYDGDRKTDPAVYQDSTGYWHIMTSGTGYTLATPFKLGEQGYTAVPADYDGDRKTDPAVYQESTGQWYIMKSSEQYNLANIKLGEQGYIPVPADYDGDGYDDLAVYQNETSNWYIYSVHYNCILHHNDDAPPAPRVNFCNNSDPSSLYGRWVAGELGGLIPVPGDYDNDNRSDFAVWNPLNGNWYIFSQKTSSSMFGTVGNFIPKPAGFKFGDSSMTPVPGDYDGDGYDDLALYQESTGYWHIMTSGTGYTLATPFKLGEQGYTPIPADYDSDCICTPNCTGKVCGDDGCGGNCGSCSTYGEICSNGTCVVDNSYIESAENQVFYCPYPLCPAGYYHVNYCYVPIGGNSLSASGTSISVKSEINTIIVNIVNCSDVAGGYSAYVNPSGGYCCGRQVTSGGDGLSGLTRAQMDDLFSPIVVGGYNGTACGTNTEKRYQAYYNAGTGVGGPFYYWKDLNDDCASQNGFYGNSSCSSNNNNVGKEYRTYDCALKGVDLSNPPDGLAETTRADCEYTSEWKITEDCNSSGKVCLNGVCV